MNYRKFAVSISAAVVVFFLGNLLIWKLATEAVLTKKYDGGDLVRGSYIMASKYYRKNHIDLPRRHFLLDYAKPGQQRADILTIGDSFSMGLGEGKNHFYQDYLATLSNARVANVYPYPFPDAVKVFSPLNNLILFYNSGLLDEIGPRYVLLESAERYCVQRFSRPYDFGISETKEKVKSYYRDRHYIMNYLPEVGCVNSGNAHVLYLNLKYRFSERANPDVVYTRLTRPVFSRNGDHLLFLNEDLESRGLVTEQSVAQLNDNMNRMADLLDKKGIKLVFMPVVDKSDLYGEYMASRSYPKSTFFEKLRALPKRYQFIDTKKLLKEEVDRGVLDVFYPDESHWSYKAPEKIFSTVRFDCGTGG